MPFIRVFKKLLHPLNPVHVVNWSSGNLALFCLMKNYEQQLVDLFYKQSARCQFIYVAAQGIPVHLYGWHLVDASHIDMYFCTLSNLYSEDYFQMCRNMFSWKACTDHYCMLKFAHWACCHWVSSKSKRWCVSRIVTFMWNHYHPLWIIT